MGAAALIKGIEITNYLSALLVVLVLALLHWTVEPVLQFLALPITFITLGLFSWVVSALVIWLAGAITPGFRVRGFVPALLMALVLAVGFWLVERVLL